MKIDFDLVLATNRSEGTNLDEVRKYILLVYSPHEQVLHMSGVDFREYINAAQPHGLVLTNQQVDVGHYDPLTNTSYVDVDHLQATFAGLEECADLNCFDTPSRANYESTARNLTSLLNAVSNWDFSNALSIVKRLNGRFFYVSHDNGWYTKILAVRAEDLKRLVTDIVSAKFASVYKLQPLLDENHCDWWSVLLAGGGVYLDYERPSVRMGTVFVPCFRLGPVPLFADSTSLDMDELLNGLERYQGACVGYLRGHSSSLESSDGLKAELLKLASVYEPNFVPVLIAMFQAGGRVMRRKTGSKAGTLYISLSPSTGADYSAWNRLNHGAWRNAYHRLQEHSARQFHERPAEEDLLEN